MEYVLISTLNGVAYGLLLFMLSAGLTLVFSLMGVLNFAHASFYMLGAYLGFQVSGTLGFGAAMVLAPLMVGLSGAAFERWVLRRVRIHGHVQELLVTFGLSYLVLELVQLLWGRSAVEFHPPQWLQGAAFSVMQAPLPKTRALMAVVAIGMLVGLWLVQRTRVGLVIQAARTHPQMVQALGHDVPTVLMWVFGLGTGLAGLAGVLAGSTFVTEPAMALSMGSIVFVVVVVGGIGSLPGAFVASLAIGLMQTYAVAFDRSVAQLASAWGAAGDTVAAWPALMHITLAQVAPVLPYMVLVLVLLVRPQGLMGRREA